MGWREPSLYPSAAHPHSTLAAVGAGSGGGGLWFAPLTCWGGVRRWQRWGYIHRAVLAGTVGASLAVLRGRGSLSMFLLLLLHLLYDFPDLALCSLTGKEMPNDFNDDLLVLVRGLVSWHNDFCTS